MKIIICFSLLFSSFVWSKSVNDLNSAILKDVKEDIQKDAEKFKKTPTRGPASIGPVEKPRIVAPDKLDKNVKQIGPNEW